MATEESALFDPKTFLESLFKTREAEIEVLLNNSTNTTTGDEDNGEKFSYKPDVYFVIGAVSFVILVIIGLAIYKAFIMLKISLNDGIDDTVPVDSNHQNGQIWNGN